MASLKSILVLSLLTAASTVNAHAYFHKAFVNDADQGQLFGVRAPQSNSPIQDVTSSAITCNAQLQEPVSKDVIEVTPGDKFGMQWNHGIDGPQGADDADDPIAASHKGPVMAYMAKVDNASSNDGSGLSWFKVAEEGLDTTTGKWGVDTLIANKGLWSFTMPSLAPGDYLLRGEIIALHSAGSTGQAQFYMSCAAIRVSGSGTCSPTDTVSFPGAYSANDPGILISIYGNTGTPDNGGKPYTIPGPSVATCSAGSAPAPSASSSAPPSSSASSSASFATSSSSSTSMGAAVSVTATPSTNVAVPSSAPSSSTPAAPVTETPAESSTPAPPPAPPAPSTVPPVSFSSTVTGRIGKPTKFVCYVEEPEL